MEFRRLGRTDMTVSAIGFGAWAIGGAWGTVDDADSLRALHAAVDAGVNFIDTADVYGDGRSERLVARLRRERPKETLCVATKAGRRLPQQTAEGYSRENLAAWVDRSLRNLETEAIDLLQLHCPHPGVYARPEVFGFLDDMFRLKPAEAFFPEAKARGVGILARVPLASGLLTGKLRKDSRFEANDHRQFNRQGEAFDKGETFSGQNHASEPVRLTEVRETE